MMMKSESDIVNESESEKGSEEHMGTEACVNVILELKDVMMTRKTLKVIRKK